MQKIYFPSILSFIVGSLISLVCVTAQAQDPIRIGVIAPLTGEFSNWGENVRAGIEFARESLPEDVQKQLEVYFEDDQFSGSKTLGAFQALKEKGELAGLIVVGSSAGNTIAPLIEREKIPTIAVGASDINVVKGRKYAFTHWVSPETEGRHMAAEVVRRGYKKIALLLQEHAGLRAITEAFEHSLASSPVVKVEFSKVVSPDMQDFRALIPGIKSKNVDAVALLLFPNNVGVFGKQAKSAVLGKDLFGAETFEDKDVLKNYGTYLVNSWYASGAGATPEFVGKYAKKYGSGPGFAGANGHDAFGLIVAAYLAAQKEQDRAAKMADYLHDVKDFKGALGTYSATGDNRFDVPSAIMMVTEGGFVPYPGPAGTN